jgi:cytochrome c oxidase subunit 4
MNNTMTEDKKSRHLPGDPVEHHVVSYRFLSGVWLGLIILTVMTVLISVLGTNLVAFSVVTALVIASAKVTVVANYFMHLKYESKILAILVSITLLLFIIFITITAFDYLTR